MQMDHSLSAANEPQINKALKMIERSLGTAQVLLNS